MSEGKGYIDQFLATQNAPEEPANEPATEEPQNPTEPTNENEQEQEEPVNPEQPQEPVQPTEELPPTNEDPQEPVTPQEPIEIDESQILAYLKDKKGKEIKSIDDLFKTPEPVADPLEGVDEEVLQFVKFNKETGRGLQDWNSLNTDYTKLNPLEAARQKVIQMTEGELKGEEIDQFLEKKLNIDLSDLNNIERFDEIELKTFSKDYINAKIKEQETYKQPITPKQQPEVVTLENGATIPKAQYEAMEQQRQSYINNIQSAADNIKNFEFKVKIDNNGVEQTYDLDYEYSKEDKHNMLTSALEVDKAIGKLFTTKEGFNHQALAESMNWIDPNYRGKMINVLIQKGIAKHTEEIARKEHNTNFGQKNIPAQQSKKTIVPLQQGQQPGVVNTEIFNIKP